MGSLEPTAEEVRALVAEARAEARIEAKEILRGRFVEEYLRAAADGAEQPPPRQVPEPARAHEPASPPVAAPSGDAWYVYCVAEAGVAAALTGVAGREVQTVEAAGLAALASRVPLDEFGEDGLRRNLNDLEWLEATARAHQDVLDAARESGAIVPLRLCTIYASDGRVRELLVDERERFGEALKLLSGKSEWGVKGFADVAALERAAVAADGETAGGSAYFDRKRRERDAREDTLRAIDESIHEVHARLAEWATDAVVNRPQNRDLAGYEGEMVLNAAYLIEDDRAEEFAALVDSFGERHARDGLRFELTGPWPPYNFVPGGGSEL